MFVYDVMRCSDGGEQSELEAGLAHRPASGGHCQQPPAQRRPTLTQ